MQPQTIFNLPQWHGTLLKTKTPTLQTTGRARKPTPRPDC